MGRVAKDASHQRADFGPVPVVRDNQIDAAADGASIDVELGPYEPAALLEAIHKATDLYKDLKAWQRLMANGMKADFSWDRSAKSYLNLYQSF